MNDRERIRVMASGDDALARAARRVLIELERVGPSPFTQADYVAAMTEAALDAARDA